MVDGPLFGRRGKGHHLQRGGVWGDHGIRGRPSATVSETRGISLRNRERAQRLSNLITPGILLIQTVLKPREARIRTVVVTVKSLRFLVNE